MTEKSKNERIIIPAKVVPHLKPGQQAIVRVSPEVYNMLVDIANESVLPINRVASAIIKQAIEKDLVQLERGVS